MEIFRQRNSHGVGGQDVTTIFWIKSEAIKDNMRQKLLSEVSVLYTFGALLSLGITYLVNSFIEGELSDWSIDNFSDLLALGNVNMIFIQGGNCK